MPQKIIEPVAVDSFESILMNIDTYLDKFSKDAVVVLRGIRISRAEQLIIMRLFGDRANWHPNSNTEMQVVWSYEENHSRTMDQYHKHNTGKDELFLPWHLEHMGHKNPAIGASWNMEKFTCERGIGNTLFCNISDICDTYSQEEIEFLKKCKIAAFYGWAFDAPGPQVEPTIHDAVTMHELSGRYALRLNALFKYDKETFYLHSFDDREPTDAENDRFLELSVRFTEHIHDNEDIRQVHIWQQHDLVIVDLFLMAHAVLGGFKSSDRFFHGYWAHAKESSKYE